jgi:two-component system, OmpR family, alkaline phosphatase synthesis response regulator PhoP
MDNSGKKILIVEDDVDLRNILVDGLSISNYKILQAGDGEKAVETILEERPDLILLDLLLPKLDGFKVLERLRQYPDKAIAQTKVVVLSNLWSDKDILRAKALKVDEYYVKSNSNMEEIFAKIKTIINSPTNT